MSKRTDSVVERSRNDIDNQADITSTSLSDRAFWTAPNILKTIITRMSTA